MIKRVQRFYEAEAGAEQGAGSQTQETQAGGAPETETKEGHEQTYNNKQVNDLIAKNNAKVTRKLLDKLGIDDIDAFVASRASKKQEAEASKTPDQKASDELKQLRDQLAELKADNTQSKLEAAALKAGVPDTVAAKIAKAAAGYEGDTPAERIAAYVKDFPWIVKPAQAEAPKPTGPSFGAKTTTQLPDATKTLIDQIEEMNGIKRPTLSVDKK
jgi:hypothetical protein